MKTKWIAAAAIMTVYFCVPAYRYYVIGSWIAYKIASDKRMPRYLVVAKGTKHYNRLVGKGA